LNFFGRYSANTSSLAGFVKIEKSEAGFFTGLWNKKVKKTLFLNDA